MKLYYSPGTCALATHIILQEIGANYLLAKVHLASKKTEGDADYTRINPSGTVPALELESEEILTENAVILQYLADTYGAEDLLPPMGTMERYRYMEVLNFITTEIHKTFSAVFNAEKIMNSKHQAETLKAACLQKLDQKFALISLKLGLNDFVMGNEFSIIDAYLFVMLMWAEKFKLNLSFYSNLGEYYRRLSARPSIVRAMKEEGIGGFPKVEVSAGPYKSPLP